MMKEERKVNGRDGVGPKCITPYMLKELERLCWLDTHRDTGHVAV